eukprot:4846961-Pyramimonas_sp.AAC.1
MKVLPDVISYRLAVNACEKGGQWQQALFMLRSMCLRRLDAGFIAYGITAGMCEQGGHWRQ